MVREQKGPIITKQKTADGAEEIYIWLNLQADRMIPETEIGQEIIDNLKRIVEEYPEIDKGVVIQPGQGVWVRNDMGVLHKRTAFTPKKEVNERRWLVRTSTEKLERDGEIPQLVRT